MSELNIYKASAGSGKTFALTLEYFKLVFAAPYEYRQVLAVTFTNKATEEMKSRIIGELHKLARGIESPYTEKLESVLRLSVEQIRERAGLLQTLILHDYGRLSVTTIDRFFQRIVKAFTRELGLFPGYNVELDNDFVLMQAVDQLIHRMGEDKELRKWILELMDNRVEDAKSWSVKSKINELGRELFGESYMLLDTLLLERFSDKNFLNDYRVFLIKTIRSFERRMMEYGTEGCRIIAEAGLEPSDFKGTSRSFMYIFDKWKENKLDSISNTTRNAVDNLESWSVKKQEGWKQEKIESVYPELNKCLGDAIAYYDREVLAYNSAKQLYDNLYQLGILNDLYREIRRFCEEKGVMLLSDTTRVLHLLIAGNDASFLFEKSGNYYKHILIDEFQDTSTMQWQNFRPLIVNTLSDGGKALLVGDVKQSIYRWRNGEWRLLAEGVEQEFSAMGVHHTSLEKNWRSSGEVVAFNNVFFEKAATLLRVMFEAETGTENSYSRSITDAYAGVKQIVTQSKPGYVEVVFGGDKRLEESQTEIMERMVSALSDYRKRGGELRECVVLVRKAGEGAVVADFLMEYNKRPDIPFPIPFVSNDSLYLSSSPYVELIVNALRYIAEPYDEVNRATLLYNYHTFVEPTAVEDMDSLFRGTDFSILTQSSTGSLFERVEQLIGHFGLRNNVAEIPYLVAFQDAVFQYESGNTNSVPLFLEWWEKEKTKRVLSTSEATDALRILTIHKSKGLEYNVVVLPFCNWELDDTRHGRRIWGHNKEEGFSELELAPLNYSSRLKETYFQEDYFEEHMKSYVDNLNLLYVAFTRAKNELYVYPFAPKISKDGKPADIGGVAFQVLELLNEEDSASGWDAESMQLMRGTKHCRQLPEAKQEDVIHLSDYPMFELNERVSIRYRYKDYGDTDTVELSPVDEGKLLHEIFRRIRTFSDVEEAVYGVFREGLIGEKEKVYYVEKVNAYLRQAGVSEWFGQGVQVMNERDILFRTARIARPDRVMIDGRNAVVVDFKFGRKEEESYRKQLSFYCNSLRQMGYRNVTAYIWYVNLEKIVDINS